MNRVTTQEPAREIAAVQSARWHRINSFMAAVANAIELADAAGLRSFSDRLLVLQRDALQERERA